MGSSPSNPYLAATTTAGLIAVVGAWLPWVQKHPVGTIDGQAYYTTEWITGLDAGFRGIDWVIIGLVLAAIGLTVLARTRSWRPDIPNIAIGATISITIANIGRTYWIVDRYTAEPGFYLLLGGGLILAGIGVLGLLRHRIPVEIPS